MSSSVLYIMSFISCYHCTQRQVDWEALLSQHPQRFIDAVSPWLLPPEASQSNAHDRPQGEGDEQGQGCDSSDGQQGAGVTADRERHRSDASSGGQQGSGCESPGAAVEKGQRTDANQVCPLVSVNAVPPASQVVGTVRRQLWALTYGIS